jgi:hypothetical protein
MDNSKLLTINQKDQIKYSNSKSLLSIYKRFFSQMDLIIMFFNTISSIFSITSSLSNINTIEYNTYIDSFCDNGKPIGYSTQCPYLNSPQFIIIILLWVLYFIMVFFYKYQWTNKYEINDLRYYIAYDRCNHTTSNNIHVYIGKLSYIYIYIYIYINLYLFICLNILITSLYIQ